MPWTPGLAQLSCLGRYLSVLDIAAAAAGFFGG